MGARTCHNINADRAVIKRPRTGLFTLVLLASIILVAQTRAEMRFAEPVVVTGDRNYPPYCYVDNGIPSGFDIDIIRAIAKALDMPIVIELRAWSDARHDLETGRADIIPGMARIPAREDVFDFTIPIKYLGFDLFVPDDSPIESLEDARDARILVQKSGVMYDLIRQEGRLRNITPVTDAPEAIDQLARGACEGAIVNRVQGHFVMAERKIRGIRNLDARLPTLPYSLAVRKGETELVNLLNEGLNIIRVDGTYDRIYEQWFGFAHQRKLAHYFEYLFIAALVAGVILVLLATINRSLRRQIQHRTAELRQLIDLLPHAIFARDRNGRYTMCNQSAADSMGLDIADIIGRSQDELYPGYDHNEQYMREDRQVLETGEAIFVPETAYIDRHGQRRYLQVTKIPFQVRNGVPEAVLSTAVDITRLKAAEEVANRSRENLMVILNAITDGVIAVDETGKVTLINHVACQFTGSTETQAMDQPLPEVLRLTTPEGDPFDVAAVVTRAIAEQENAGLSFHTAVTDTAGGQRDLSLNWAPIRYENRPIGLVIVLRDITEELRINRRLQETQKMESIGRLAGGVAHDFNNLLTGIMGYSELLNISLPGQDESRTYLKGIFEASERARDLVQQLLTFSRRQPKENKPVNLHTIIGHVSSLLQHTLDRRITISRHLHAAAFTVLGDRSQLQNALLNLGINARDAMPNGGTLTIGTSNVKLTAAECRRLSSPVKPGLYIEVVITDTGTGMDPETMAHIFEPFFTTKGQSGGTGLGLAAVYGTVKDHGGYIDVASRPGHGSTFRLGIPVIEICPDETEYPADVQEFRGSGGILIVDDEPHVLKTMEAIIRTLGYTTLTAVNGRDALAVYTAHRDEIDLVILDMIMPEMNGEQTFRELRRINPDIKVMISSGYLQEHNISDLYDLGILGMLQKPFRKKDLAQRIATCLRYGATS